MNRFSHALSLDIAKRSFEWLRVEFEPENGPQLGKRLPLYIGSNPSRAPVNQPNENRFHLLMLFGGSALLLIAPTILKTFRLEISLATFTPVLKFLVPALLPAILYAQWARRYRLRDGLLLFLWMTVCANLLSLPMYAAARFHMPLRDAALGKVDSSIGLNVQMFTAFAARHGWFAKTFSISYNLLYPMIFAASIVPLLAGKYQAAKEYIIANCFASLTAAFTFAMIPAVGPWKMYGFHATEAQQACESMLTVLREPTPYKITLAEPGVVCFPSFHVILAVLCARALWSVRALRPFAIALCAFIIISTLTTGWHYSIDVLGGLAFAAASIAAAKTYTRIEAKGRWVLVDDAAAKTACETA